MSLTVAMFRSSAVCVSTESTGEHFTPPPTFPPVLYTETKMFDELWSEIQEAPGEIFDLDIPELRDDEQFNMNEYLNADYDY